jgi:hypothetical protein
MMYGPSLALLLILAVNPPPEGLDLSMLEQDSYRMPYQEAGFAIVWPSGCAEVAEQVSDGPTQRAAREFFYSCSHEQDRRHGVSVLRLQRAQAERGQAPHPRFVVELIEQHLALFAVRIVRQRPLQLEGMEGVDVHATEPMGLGEVWVRGLLIGTDVFVLMAWNRAGGLFEDAEIQQFIDSLELI